MATENLTTVMSLTPEEALAVFASVDTAPEERRAALSALITAKVLPKQADDPAIAAGRQAWLALLDAPDTAPEHRLLAIAESIRLGQVVKRWAAEIGRQLRPAFAAELPPARLLAEADDRLNLARACSLMSSDWLPAYLARAIADEETGERARTEMVAGLLAQCGDLATVLGELTQAFEALRPETELPGDTAARRLTRTLAVLRAALLEAELDAGHQPGKALYELLALPLSTLGKPQTEKVQLDLVREALLTVHDIVRTRISVAADPQMYSVVAYCRRLVGPSTWPKELEGPLERLITDVSEALILLGRQGQRDQALLGQLDVLCSHAEHARVLARKLAQRHPELPEDVRYWLEHGRARVVREASESAREAAASTADASIGVALQTARRTRNLGDGLKERLVASLEIYEPALIPAVRDLFDRTQALAVQVEQVASLRELDLYGLPGEEVEMSPKFFTAVGDGTRQRMTVRQPAIVRKRADGSVGEVLAKGIVD